jgi:16S rRNA (guanine527-N7)-methyltransferase
VEQLSKYFPGLTDAQRLQFERLGPVYTEWNARINVISRKDIENLYERHILHSLAIARVISFRPGTRVMDAGTGGGFPGVPLAIMFPEVHFHLVDSTAKKLNVIEAVVAEIGLKNISTEHCRLETHMHQYDFVVSRAVASLDEMIRWVWKNVGAGGFNELPNGLLYLKGEIQAGELPNKSHTVYNLSSFFIEPFFETKVLVHLF